jgi:hypothetical protein
MKLTYILFAAAVTCVCTGAMAQWQWIDKDGRKVFSDRAPPPDIADKSIVKRPPGRVPSPAAPAAEAGSSDAASAPALVASAPKGIDKDLEAKKKQAADAEAAKRKADEERVTKARIENCARAKQAKVTFDSGVRISRTSPSGEREFMDDAARATELKRIQGIIDADCK